jgi:hypothetical protein
MTISHPLKEGTVVEGTRASCACRGAKQVPFKGAIKKIIANHSGVWYYLDIGITVKSDAITVVHSK